MHSWCLVDTNERILDFPILRHFKFHGTWSARSKMQADFVLYHSREKGVDFTLENIHVFSQYDTEILDLDQMLMFHLEKGYRLSGNQPKSILKSDSQVSMTGRESREPAVSPNGTKFPQRESTTGSRELTIGNRSNSIANSISNSMKNDDVIKRESVAEREANISRRSNLESTSSPSANR